MNLHPKILEGLSEISAAEAQFKLWESKRFFLAIGIAATLLAGLVVWLVLESWWLFTVVEALAFAEGYFLSAIQREYSTASSRLREAISRYRTVLYEA